MPTVSHYSYYTDNKDCKLHTKKLKIKRRESPEYRKDLNLALMGWLWRGVTLLGNAFKISILVSTNVLLRRNILGNLDFLSFLCFSHYTCSNLLNLFLPRLLVILTFISYCHSRYGVLLDNSCCINFFAFKCWRLRNECIVTTVTARSTPSAVRIIRWRC